MQRRASRFVMNEKQYHDHGQYAYEHAPQHPQSPRHLHMPFLFSSFPDFGSTPHDFEALTEGFYLAAALLKARFEGGYLGFLVAEGVECVELRVDVGAESAGIG